jgi:hypothetical protein
VALRRTGRAPFRQAAGVLTAENAASDAGLAVSGAGTNRAKQRAVFRRLCSSATLTTIAALGLGTVLCGAAGCAHTSFFPGTTIVRTDENQKIIDTVDLYRQRLTQQNVDGLIMLASEHYREDSGTPRSDDDYGYSGLKEVLRKRLSRLKSIWYEIELREIQVHDRLAEVDVFLNGSFELGSLAPEVGDRYHRVTDYHRFVLEKEGDKWKFVSGM